MTVSLEQRFKDHAKQIGEKNHLALEQVILDGDKIEHLGSLDFLSKCKATWLLSLNHTGLKSLQKFPADTAIKALELADNDLTGGWECLVPIATLEELQLGGNQINSAKDIECLSAIPNLKVISLTDCPITNTPDYRKAVFAAIPSLIVVDMHNKEGEEVDLGDDESELGSDYSDSEEGDEDLSDEDSDDDSEGDDDEDSDDSEDEDESDDEPSAKKAKKE